MADFVVSAPSLQPGKELVSCWPVKTSLIRRSVKQSNSMEGGTRGGEAFFSPNLIPKSCCLCGRQSGSWEGGNG